MGKQTQKQMKKNQQNAPKKKSRIQKNQQLYKMETSTFSDQTIEEKGQMETRNVRFVGERLQNKSHFQKLIFIFAILSVVFFLICVFLFYRLGIEKKTYQKQKKILVEEIEETKFITENLLIGDSITFYYNTHRYFKTIPVFKSAVCGYTSSDILDNFNSLVESYNPKNVILLIGTNDIERGISNQEIIETIDKIASKVKDLSATLMIQSVYPVSESKKYYVGKRRKNERIMELNQTIKEYCQKEKITYIDVYSSLTDEDGNLKEEYTSDGLHVSDKAYEKITTVLEKVLQ